MTDSTPTAADPAATRALLEERAERLARRSHDSGTAAGAEFLADVVVVERAGVRLGLPSIRVVEIRPVQTSFLPRATAAVQSLFQVRGTGYTLVDPAPLLDADATPLAPGSRCLAAVVEAADGLWGLRLDAVAGARPLYQADIAVNHEPAKPFVRFLTTDLINVVDVDALLADPAAGALA